MEIKRILVIGLDDLNLLFDVRLGRAGYDVTMQTTSPESWSEFDLVFLSDMLTDPTIEDLILTQSQRINCPAIAIISILPLSILMPRVQALRDRTGRKIYVVDAIQSRRWPKIVREIFYREDLGPAAFDCETAALC